MARPRKRFCPYGHDRDAPGGSRWRLGRTLKGTPTRYRVCVECARARDRRKQEEKPWDSSIRFRTSSWR